MNAKLKIGIFFLLLFNIGMLAIVTGNRRRDPELVQIQTSPVPGKGYIGKVKFDGVSVRLLVLKHTFEQMANDDARLAIDAANLARTNGLTIKDIGEHNIGPNGKINRLVFDKRFYGSQLQSFISEQMKIDAEPGDTLVIMTIGHGMPSGTLVSLGSRKEVMTAMANAASENGQETVWWQLSCYASARLPKITELSSSQQDLFAVVASSDSRTQSPAYVEGKIMQKVFVAMANKDSSIDPNNDEIVVAEELANFLEDVDHGRGQLVYAASPQEPLFGLSSQARLPQIIDRNNPQGQYPRDYIPLPQRR